MDRSITKPGNIDEGFRSGEHGEKAQQQNLIERIKNLAGPARIVQRLEMTQKYDNLAKCPSSPAAVTIMQSPKKESEDRY